MDLAPPRTTCNVRRVTTFGRGATTDATELAEADALEKKPTEKIADATGTLGATMDEVTAVAGTDRALGVAGYNVPSLYGMAFGAPFLHQGGAKTLEDLMTDARWSKHRTSGNANYSPSAAEVADLKAFLLSIDATTPEINDVIDACPAI